MELFFPPVSPFLELIQRAEQKSQKIILRDHSTGKSATAGELLSAVAHFRKKVKGALQRNGLYDTSDDSRENFIFLLASPGWEYVVSMLTILSLGAGMSAQCE